MCGTSASINRVISCFQFSKAPLMSIEVNGDDRTDNNLTFNLIHEVPENFNLMENPIKNTSLTFYISWVCLKREKSIKKSPPSAKSLVFNLMSS